GPAHPCEPPGYGAPQARPCEQVPSPRRAGDPVRLDPRLFTAPGAGGVGREPIVLAPVRRLLVSAPDPAPRSAGSEAARRGLGRD
ncbi:MAG: hypothetical protein ACLFQ5_12830, partial [Oceanicaulis sp.]